MAGHTPIGTMRPFDIRYRNLIREVSTDWRMENHYHNDCELIFILEGEIELNINQTTYRPGKNSLIFINNMERHGYKILQYPYKRYVIMLKHDYMQAAVDDPVLTSVFQHRPEKFNHVMAVPDHAVPAVCSAMGTLFREYKGSKPFRDVNLKMQLYQLMIAIYRVSDKQFPMAQVNSTTNQLIASIQSHVETHYMEELSLKDVSRMFYTDMYYLCHLFKEVTGYTFKSYLIMHRISKAKDMLAYTDDDITQVGLNCGFNNVNHFIRTFKKMLGITPYQYRKKHKETSTL